MARSATKKDVKILQGEIELLGRHIQNLSQQLVAMDRVVCQHLGQAMSYGEKRYMEKRAIANAKRKANKMAGLMTQAGYSNGKME